MLSILCPTHLQGGNYMTSNNLNNLLKSYNNAHKCISIANAYTGRATNGDIYIELINSIIDGSNLCSLDKEGFKALLYCSHYNNL